MILHRLTTLHLLAQQVPQVVLPPHRAAVCLPLLTQVLVVAVLHHIRHQVLPSHPEEEVGVEAEANERDLHGADHTLHLHLHLRPQEVDPELLSKVKVVENMIPGHHHDQKVGVGQ